jgi:predicted DNA-binding protein with PD1-like motif
MDLHPLRLSPGDDLRRSIEACLARAGRRAGFVVSGIGSLVEARIRYAGQADEDRIEGPLEIIGLAGSVSPDGAHLHMSVSTAAGRVIGGHAGYGNVVRTTAEILLAFLPGWRMSRELDPATGYRELVVRRAPQGDD